MHVNFVDFHHHRQFRGATLQGHRLQQPGLTSNEAATIDTEGFIDTRDDEDQTNVAIFQQVAMPVDALVAKSIRNRDGSGIEHLHHTRGISLGGNITVALGIGGGNHEVWRPCDELLDQRREVGGVLFGNRCARHPVDLVNLVFAGDSMGTQPRHQILRHDCRCGFRYHRHLPLAWWV